MKKRVTIYPFIRESFAFVNNFENLTSGKYELAHIVAPTAYLNENDDIARVQNRRPVGIKITNDIERAISDCDTFIVLDSKKEILHDKSITYAKLALSQGKEVLYCDVLNADEKTSLEKTSHENKGSCIKILSKGHDTVEQYINTYIFKDTNSNPQVRMRNSSPEQIGTVASKELYMPKSSIIYVASAIGYSHSEEVVYELCVSLRNRGYKISALGYTGSCEVFDNVYPVPDFMYDENLSHIKKLHAFNEIIRRIDIHDQPEAIIVCIPGGILIDTYEYFADMGVTSYVAAHATLPDFVILSINDGFDIEQNSKIYSDLCLGKLGGYADCFTLTNVHFDKLASDNIYKPQYFHLPEEKIKQKLRGLRDKKLGFPVFTVYDKYEVERLTECVLKKLDPKAV